MPPLCLTDSQMNAVLAAAEPLACADRPQFLEAVAARLGARAEPPAMATFTARCANCSGCTSARLPRPRSPRQGTGGGGYWREAEAIAFRGRA